MSTGNHTVLTTTEAGSRAPLLFDSEGTTSVMDNAANTSVCNNSCLYIGPIIDYNVTLENANVMEELVLILVPSALLGSKIVGKLSYMSLKTLCTTHPHLSTLFLLVELVSTSEVYTLLQLTMKKELG